jgi:hypothetical protein
MRQYILFVLLILTNTSFEQSTKPKCEVKDNIVSMDFSAMIFTGVVNVNYERFIGSIKTNQLFLNGAVGLWYYFFNYSSSASSSTLSLSLNNLTGCKNNHFEIDIGGRYIINNKDKYGYNQENRYPHIINSLMKYNIYPIANIGFRHQSTKNNAIYRVFIGLSGLGFGYGISF